MAAIPDCVTVQVIIPQKFIILKEFADPKLVWIEFIWTSHIVKTLDPNFLRRI